MPSTLQQAMPASVPNIIHFIYLGGRPFSFIHFLAVYTAWKINRPDMIYFHYTELPSGKWWLKAKPFLTLNPVAPVHEIHGHPIKYLAHMADVIRLEQLARHGGIYLDLDVICINPLKPLMQHDSVMGMEAGTGLCNAVIMAKPNAAFIRQWQDSYVNFDAKKWNYHSVIFPWTLAQRTPDQIFVADQYAFFYPTHNDPIHAYLWGHQPSWKQRLIRVVKNIARLATGKHDAIRRSYYLTFHALRGKTWHLNRLRQSYCIHLWEGLWGEPYLKDLSPDYLRHSDANFARLLREKLSAAELDAMDSELIAEPPMQQAALSNHGGQAVVV